MRKSILAVLAVTVVALGVAATGSAASWPKITGVSYYPRPIYDDGSFLNVRFHTDRPAWPGYEYAVSMFVGGKYARAPYCSSIGFSWDPKFGGNRRSHATRAGWVSKTVLGTRYGYWCRGTAYVDIVEHRIGSSEIGTTLGSFNFRIAAAP